MLSRPSEPPPLLWLDDQALIASQDVARFHSFADPTLQDEGLGSIRSGLTFKFQTKNSRELVFAGEGLDGPLFTFRKMAASPNGDGRCEHHCADPTPGDAETPG
jgi:hypothetical protein